jgi:hypothetical protein
MSEWQRPQAALPTYPLVDGRDLVGHHVGPVIRSAVVSGNSFEDDCCWAAVTNKAAQHNTNADMRKPESLVSLTVFNSMSQFTPEMFACRGQMRQHESATSFTYLRSNRSVQPSVFHGPAPLSGR